MLVGVMLMILHSIQSEGRGTPCMATSLTERMAHLEGEALKEEEEHSKDAIASAYAGK